jgi:hypothetical protein
MGERLTTPRGFLGLYERRRTRRRRQCSTCRRVFEPGEFYVRSSLPPGSELGNERWHVLVTCGVTTSDCPRYWEIDSRVMAGDLAADDDPARAVAGPHDAPRLLR